MKSIDQWMSDEEWASWSVSRGMGHSAVTKNAIKKPSLTRLNLTLLDCCAKGSADGALAALDQGANPNARARSSPGESALVFAIQGGHDELALEIMKRGGWPAPSRWGSSDVNSSFDKASLGGGFSETERKNLGIQALGLFTDNAKSWGLLKKARDWACPAMPDKGLLGLAFKNERFDLALEAGSSGVFVDALAWECLENMLGGYRRTGFKEHRLRKDFIALLAESRSVAKMGLDESKILFRAAIEGEDSELLLALLDARLRPGPDWTVRKRDETWRESAHGESDKTRSLLWSVSKLQNPDLLEVLRRCAPAVDAAKARQESPWSMSESSIGRVMELHEMGVPIDGRDEDGNGLAHCWAKIDREPRDGWATLARKAPGVFAMLDAQGRAGYERMAEKLDGEFKDVFLAALSRIESRDIKREVAPAKKKKDEAKARRL